MGVRGWLKSFWQLFPPSFRAWVHAQIGRTYKLLTGLQDWTCDHTYGIRTIATGERRVSGWGPSAPSSYHVLFKTRRLLRLGSRDVIYDLGCGNGRALAVFAATGARTVGVEIAEGLAAEAQRNVGDRLRVSVLNRDARTLDFSDATVLFLYNPFANDVLADVLQHATRPGLRIAYYNPVHEATVYKAGYRQVARATGFHRDVVIFER